jgi:hypothetical protein
MIRLVTRGRLSQNYAKAFLAAPEDREPAVRKLVEAAGGKVINFTSRPAVPTSCSFLKLTMPKTLSLR